jgi:hypothetical protein
VPVGVLTWDGTGEKVFETGVDHGVLYPLNPSTSLYDDGVAWNGLTAVNEKPSGASANKTYADNILYSNIRSAELFGGTITAYTYPDEFGPCDGGNAPTNGVNVGQQPRQTFGLCYRTKVGNDINGELGFKLHLVYGATASPSEKDYATVNDSPASVEFSWDFDCLPVPVTGLSPTSILVIDSTKVDATALGDLMDDLYGTVGTAPLLPDPDTVLAFFTGSITSITLTPATFDGAHTITIPTQTGVKYYVDGVFHAAGSQLLTTGQKKVVSAVAQPGYHFTTPVVKEWMFTFVS